MRLMRHTFSKENGQHLSRILCHTLKIYILKKIPVEELTKSLISASQKILFL